MNDLLRKHTNKTLELLLSKETSPTRRLLYLLFMKRSVKTYEAENMGIKNVAESAWALRQKGWDISNDEDGYTISNIK